VRILHRRLEDRIRLLANRVAEASDEEFSRVLAELHIAMSEYARRLENKAALTVLRGPEALQDRRGTKRSFVHSFGSVLPV
jgi:hypothetical protein